MEYVKKYDEDLNTTPIFVRRSSSALASCLTCSYRQVCSLLPAPLLSPVSIRTSNPTRATNPPFSFMRSPSLSTSPPSRVRLPLFHPFRKIHRARLSPSPVSCMSPDLPAGRVRRCGGGAMAEPVLAQFDEHCGNRRRKCNGLKIWPLHLFVKSPPVTLWVCLLLACGLCRHMWSISVSVSTPLSRTPSSSSLASESYFTSEL